MNNLMKAEWFRLRHTGNTLLLLVFLCISSVFSQFAGDEGIQINTAVFFAHSSIGITMAVIVVTGIVAGTFNNKLVNYEIMKGTPPMQTILSKTLMSLLLITTTYYLPTVILLAVFDGAHLTLSMAVLLYICIVKLVVIAESFCIIFKDAAGVVVFGILFAFQSLPLVILQNVFNIDVVPFTSYLTSTQLMIIGDLGMIDFDDFSMPLDTSFAEVKIFLSFIAITVIMFAIAHRSLKNKWQSNIIST